MAYLVKSVDLQFAPNAMNLQNCSVKIGTFHHYRKIEDEKFRDPAEGHSGRMVKINRPSARLKDIGLDEAMLAESVSQLNSNGEFDHEFRLMLHDHLAEFNAWLFCMSLVEDLDEIPKIKEHFGANAHYFIIDPSEFLTRIAIGIQKDLRQFPLSNGEPRIVGYDASHPLYVDGWKGPVEYGSDSSWLREIEVETVEEFLDHHSREVDNLVWLRKPERFSIEREWRGVFYPASKRDDPKIYNVTDDYIIVDVDLSGCISFTPEEVIWGEQLPRLKPKYRGLADDDKVWWENGDKSLSYRNLLSKGSK